jgi:hypothetical protein
LVLRCRMDGLTSRGGDSTSGQAALAVCERQGQHCGRGCVTLCVRGGTGSGAAGVGFCLPRWRARAVWLQLQQQHRLGGCTLSSPLNKSMLSRLRAALENTRLSTASQPQAQTENRAQNEVAGGSNDAVQAFEVWTLHCHTEREKLLLLVHQHNEHQLPELR